MSISKNNKGFTLIEVMIVVAIIGIIAAVAVPSYTQYVRDTNRTDAMTQLLTYASDLERTKVLSASYGADATNAAHGTATDHFSFKITRTSTTFTLTATATSSSQLLDTDCKTLTISHLGQKKATKSDGSASTNCWN